MNICHTVHVGKSVTVDQDRLNLISHVTRLKDVGTQQNYQIIFFLK